MVEVAERSSKTIRFVPAYDDPRGDIDPLVLRVFDTTEEEASRVIDAIAHRMFADARTVRVLDDDATEPTILTTVWPRESNDAADGKWNPDQQSDDDLTPTQRRALVRLHQYIDNGTPTDRTVRTMAALLRDEFGIVLVEREHVQSLLQAWTRVGEGLLSSARVTLRDLGLTR